MLCVPVVVAVVVVVVAVASNGTRRFAYVGTVSLLSTLLWRVGVEAVTCVCTVSALRFRNFAL